MVLTSRLTLIGIAATAANSLLLSSVSANRLTLIGIAATAARPCSKSSNSIIPPHADWNRGDCGALLGSTAFGGEHRLTLIGIAATAANLQGAFGVPFPRLTLIGIAATAAKDCEIVPREIKLRLTLIGIAATAAYVPTAKGNAVLPPHADWNRGDCGSVCPPEDLGAVGPPHADWNRGDCGIPFFFVPKPVISRLTLIGIAATAAKPKGCRKSLPAPPHADWNRGDCGANCFNCSVVAWNRLTLIGIAATAAVSVAGGTGISLKPPHADWNRGDCGGHGRQRSNSRHAASR